MRYKSVDFIIKCDEALLDTMCDLVNDAAGAAGFEAFEPLEGGTRGYIQESMWDEVLLEEKLAEVSLPGIQIHYTVASLEDKNWNAAWEEQGFSPIQIASEILIYDLPHTAAEELQQYTEPIKLGIEARQAFGTGEHATTKMILEELTHISLAGKRVLDCGCGTGILSLASSKLGAEEVVAYDIDEWSVNNTSHNARLNAVENVTVLHGDAHVLSHVSGMFDILLANINRNIILADLHTFVSVVKADGIFIFSGFYEMDAVSLEEKAKELGLNLMSQSLSSDWCCLVFRKNA